LNSSRPFFNHSLLSINQLFSLFQRGILAIYLRLKLWATPELN